MADSDASSSRPPRGRRPQSRQRQRGPQGEGGRSRERQGQGQRRSSRRPHERERSENRDPEVERGSDFRRRMDSMPPTLGEKLLWLATFGLKGRWSVKKKPAPRPARPAKAAAPTAPTRENRPARSERPGPPRERRALSAPDPDAVTSPRLHVGNLSYDAAESDLDSLFNGIGRVVSVEVVTHRRTQRSKGFAFIQMADLADARRAVTELHGKDFMGRPLEIGPARAPKPAAEE